MLVKLLNLNHFKAIKIIFIGAVLLVSGLIIYFPNYAKLKKLRQLNQDLLRKNKDLHKEIKNLQIKVKRVGKDPYLYEKLARDSLGVARENEIVVDIAE
ncbi:MAG: septum formation initiator family protein [Candidatus Omnitrophica bacterium]|jgi:cell division protein FtsB|nr:septum formation initiator family protein [Candidatus Omnitrophota bacterium]